jgi:hypothetical protein
MYCFGECSYAGCRYAECSGAENQLLKVNEAKQNKVSLEVEMITTRDKKRENVKLFRHWWLNR